MRIILPLAAAVMICTPALAQAPAAGVPPAPATTATKTVSTASHHRMTMDERFAKANTTHDGHLTLAQAKAGYPTVARHFTEIDATKKGYVTESDIKGWERAQRDHHHAVQQQAAAQPKG